MIDNPYVKNITAANSSLQNVSRQFGGTLENRKQMKQITKNIFTFLGIIFLIYGIYNFVQRERLTEKYWRNIKKVKVGMSLNEARKIVGDLKYQYWTQDDKSAEIIVQNINGKPVYTLEYDMVFSGSDNPKIYFDPNTLIVTKVLTGE